MAIPRDDKMEPDTYRAVLNREFLNNLEEKDFLNILKGIIVDFEREEVRGWLTLDNKPLYEEPTFQD
jgi:penicillin-binding protein-related factor A (putative recombinase)